jgi:hypothetical protein
LGSDSQGHSSRIAFTTICSSTVADDILHLVHPPPARLVAGWGGRIWLLLRCGGIRSRSRGEGQVRFGSARDAAVPGSRAAARLVPPAVARRWGLERNGGADGKWRPGPLFESGKPQQTRL